MPGLFSRLTIGSLTVRNRLVRAPLPISAAARGGFVTEELTRVYSAWAAGGIGLILSEPLLIVPTAERGLAGLYDDLLIPDTTRLVTQMRHYQTPWLPLLSHPALSLSALQTIDLAPIAERWTAAAWRARAAGCKGIVIHGAEHSLLHQLHSPISNCRNDSYGGGGRLRLALEIVGSIRRWLGPRFVIGYRMVVDEFCDDGISLHESMEAAQQLTAAGVALLDVVPGIYPGQSIARFPGWQVPLAAMIKSVVPIPVIVNGGFSDPAFAQSVIEEGSADLLGLGSVLEEDPRWPLHALGELRRQAAVPVLQ